MGLAWLGLTPLVMAPALWVFAWLGTEPNQRQDWRTWAIWGLMIITGAIAIAGTLLIFLADLDGAVDSMLVILVWVCMTVEVSPFFVALAKNRGNGSTRV